MHLQTDFGRQNTSIWFLNSLTSLTFLNSLDSLNFDLFVQDVCFELLDFLTLLSTGVIVLIWWIWFELIVSDNYVQLIGYNVVAVVKCEGSNLPLALGLSKWCPRLFRWCCLFMCIFKSMRYFHKCKIALIAIKLLLFQAISLWIGLVKISNTSSLQLPLLRLVLYLQISICLEEFGNVTHR